MYTVQEAADELGMSAGSIRVAVARHRIVAERLGGRGQRAGLLLISEAEIARYRTEVRGQRGKYPRRASESEGQSE